MTNAGRPTILGSVEEGNSNLRWIRQTVSNPTSDYLTVIEVQVAMLESQCKSMSTRIELRLVQHDNLFGKKWQKKADYYKHLLGDLLGF